MNYKTVFKYDFDGVYICPVQAQENPVRKGIFLMPAHCTDIEPPKCVAPFVARWNGKAWEQVEDHRKHPNEKGQYDGGTPYWLPSEGDNYKSEPRYMTELGPLPDGAVTERPEKTDEEIQTEQLKSTVYESKAYLNSTDYCVLKFMDKYIQSNPEALAEFEKKYPNTLSKRQEARDNINGAQASAQLMGIKLDA